MGRPANPDLIITWKNNLPATLAGGVEHLLWDNLHNRPIYGARALLLEKLLQMWLDSVAGKNPGAFPSLEQIRSLQP